MLKKQSFDTIQNIDFKSNIKLYNLLKNMINPNPDERYNVIQCLKDPYFKK
jgi:serine/threonine protein kinase